jgi:diguanylate cyclase (GGDEF)-like protein
LDRMNGSPGTCPLESVDCPVVEEARRLREECRRLQELSQTDMLTGLFNLRFMLNILEGEMERTRRTGLPTGLIMLDIDHFKRINDTHGHESGNRALEWFSSTLRKTLRRIDIPCRYGGEEFGVVLPGTHLPEAVLTAERLRTTFAESAWERQGKKERITASFGVAAYGGGTRLSAQAFITRADQLLLKAKAMGRNRVLFDESEGTIATPGLTDQERKDLFARHQE